MLIDNGKGAWRNLTHIVLIWRRNSINKLIRAHVEFTRIGVFGSMLNEARLCLSRHWCWLLNPNEGLLDSLLHSDSFRHRRGFGGRSRELVVTVSVVGSC